MKRKAFTFDFYDRPDVGNQAWLSLGMVAEANGPATRAMLKPVRDYLDWLEKRLRKVEVEP